MESPAVKYLGIVALLGITSVAILSSIKIITGNDDSLLEGRYLNRLF